MMSANVVRDEWLSVALFFCVIQLGAEAEEKVSFSRDIRPILAENCFQCHGPDENTLEADLRLDRREGAIAELDSGEVAILPGDPEASALIARVAESDEDLRMPPADTGKRLTAKQIELLKQWIANGADYERHWSFAPVRRPELPTVEDDERARNGIDYFVLANLERHGLAPSPEADRYTLIRRVHLDLIGLPPSVDEVDAFVNDKRPGAYERMLDRVLASPRFGERWGRHWLDQARYADSHGYTNDNARTMWPYRDWVTEAFNRDLPFDQFTIEQLAGDLLAEPTLDQLVATGFHRNTLINSEGGTKADQFRDEQVKDRVDTTGVVWLGLTVGCAKCHTHKFDPISQEEYYQFYAFFNSTADRNSTTPTIKAPSARQQSELAEFDGRLTALEQQIKDDNGKTMRQRNWEQALVKQSKSVGSPSGSESEKTKWTVLELDAKSKHGATFEKLDDGSLLIGGENKANDEYKLTARSPLTKIRSVRLEALTHERLPNNGPGRAGNGNFVLSEIWFRTGDGRELRFNKAQADHSQKGYDVAGSIDGDTKTGWAINGSPEGGANHNRTAWYVLPTPLEVEEKHALTFTLQFNNGASAYNLGRLRLSILSTEWVDAPSTDVLAKLASVPAEKRSKQQQQRLDEAFLRADPQLGPIFAELKSVEKQREQLANQIPTTMVLRELDSPRQTHVQTRGDFLRPEDPVTPNVPAVLPGISDDSERRTRRELARWLTQPENPLTPRVRINRIWMRLFGRGLVETENDFGIQGTLPTHPELLDWLASEFVRQEWSTKQMLRLIMNSATYRQSSAVGWVSRPVQTGAVDSQNSLKKLDGSGNPAKGLDGSGDPSYSDPRNLLLSRQNRIRVEGELVRDLGLAVSGLLSSKIGGPSVYPPQPDGVYAFTQRKKNWRVSQGEDRFRRGMYTFFYRSAPYPMLTTFDAPKFNQTCTQRGRSNTPLQSLTVANDAAMVEMTRALARRVLEESRERESDQHRLAHAFRRCFARPPSQGELQFLMKYLGQQREHFTTHADAAREVAKGFDDSVPDSEAAAWVATARVLMNLDEFITRE